MSKKQIRDVAIVMVIVFAVTIVVYPLIFSTDEQQADQPPVEMEINK